MEVSEFLQEVNRLVAIRIDGLSLALDEFGRTVDRKTKRPIKAYTDDLAEAHRIRDKVIGSDLQFRLVRHRDGTWYAAVEGAWSGAHETEAAAILVACLAVSGAKVA